MQKVTMPSSIDPAMLAAFLAKGGRKTVLATGASTGITNREWGHLVRGEIETVLLDESVTDGARELEKGRESTWLRLNGELVR